MGLLDDAIREHLELMRRRGADPGEVSLREKEALGPYVPAELEQDALNDARVSDADFVGQQVVDEQSLDVAGGYEEPWDDSPGTYEEPPAFAEQRVDETWSGEAQIAHPGLLDQAEPRPVVEDPESAEQQQETQQHDVLADEPAPAAPTPTQHATRPAAPTEPAPSAQPEPGADDVLEQTPEFLQETPDHDRLWFEQAPPQDFDFDK